MKKTIIISFIFLLILPNFLMFFEVNSFIELNEKQQIKKFPEINIKTPVKTLKDLNLYYSNEFGYKNLSFKAYNFFKLKLLGESSVPEKLVKGKKDWYFLGNSFENVLNNSIGLTKINKQEWNFANKNIKNLFQKMERTSVPFYLFLTRQKHHIYPEYLPFSFPESKPKYDTLIENWKKNHEIIDPKETLISNKQNKVLYHKTDTHWNDYGAFYSFNYFLKRIKKELSEVKELKLEDFEVSNDHIQSNDLTQMLDQPVVEKIEVLKYKWNLDTERSNFKFNNEKGFKIVNPNKKYKIVVYHDSFTWALVKFFKASFGEVIFIKSLYPNEKLIEAEKPDLVILQFVARRIETNKISKEIIY